MTLESDVWSKQEPTIVAASYTPAQAAMGSLGVRSPNWTANSSVATLRHLPEGNAPDCTHSVQSSGAGPLPQNKLNNTSSPSLSLTSVNQTASNLITEIVTVLQAMLIKSDGQLSLSAGSTSTGDPFPPSSSQRSRENELDSMHPSLNGESLSTRLNMLISSLKTLWDNSEPDPGDSLHSAQSKSESSAFLWHSSDISVEPQDLCTLTNTIHYLVSHNKGVTRALSLLPDATRRSLEASIQCLGIICQSCHLPLPQAEASEFDISHSTTGGGATAESGENPHLTRAPEQFGCTDPLHRRGAYKVVTSDEHPSHMAHPPSSQAIPFPSSIVDADNNNNNERGYELHNEAKGDRVKAISFDDRMSNVSLSSSDESLEGNDTRQSSVLTSSSRSGSVPSLTMTVSSTYTGTVETVCDTVRDVPATITIGKSRRQRVGSLISFSRAFLPSPPASPTILESSQYQYQKSNLVRESPVFDITPVDAIHMAYTLHKSPLAQEVITPGEVESIWSTTSTTPSVVTRLRHDSLFLPLPSFVFWDRASVAEPEDIRSEMDAKNQNAQHCSPAKDALSKIHSKTGSLTGPTPQNEAGASTASSPPPSPSLLARVRARASTLHPSMRFFFPSTSSTTPAAPEEQNVQVATTHTQPPRANSESPTPPSIPVSQMTPTTLPTLQNKPKQPTTPISSSPRPSKTSGPPRSNRRLSRTPPNTLEATLLSQEVPRMGDDDKVLPLPPLDPALKAVERASKLLKSTVRCAVCGDDGKDFPRCGKCGEAWCSRECRLKNLRIAGTKRHVCCLEKLAQERRRRLSTTTSAATAPGSNIMWATALAV